MNLLILAFAVPFVILWIDKIIGSPTIYYPMAGEPLRELSIDKNAIFAAYGMWLKYNFDRVEMQRYHNSLSMDTDARAQYYATSKNWYMPLGACLFCMANWLSWFVCIAHAFSYKDISYFFMYLLFVPSTTILTLIYYKLLNTTKTRWTKEKN